MQFREYNEPKASTRPTPAFFPLYPIRGGVGDGERFEKAFGKGLFNGVSTETFPKVADKTGGKRARDGVCRAF